MSRMSWIRNLPKTREFFTKELGGIELEGHNILGDGTVQVRFRLVSEGHTFLVFKPGNRDAVTS